MDVVANGPFRFAQRDPGRRSLADAAVTTDLADAVECDGARRAGREVADG